MFKKEALVTFAQRGEKSAPPVFMGRQAIMDDIIRRADVGWQNHQSGEPGNTLVIQGAPGAGKSSIVAELKTRLNQTDHGTGEWPIGEPRVLELDPMDIVDLDLGLGQLARLVSPKHASTLAVRTMATSGIEAGADLKVVGAKGHQSRTLETATSAAMTTFKNWLMDHDITLRGPIILVIDEAQTLPPVEDTLGSRFLLSLHQNTYQLPISVVLAGLSDTQARAGDMGLTRALTVHSVGRFTREESVELMEMWCAHFGLKMGAQHQRLQVYCQLADDWPRHLHCAQKALAQVIIDKSNAQPDFTGALDALSEQEWMRVTAQFAQYRLVYYQERVSPEMEKHDGLLAHVMTSLSTTTKRSDILDMIAGRSKLPDFPYYTKETTDFLDHLIHQGALQERPGKRIIHCPIPSFRTYLIETAQSPEKDETYSIRYGSEVYKEGECESLSAARDWAMTQLPNLKADRPITLWQGAVAVDILREGTNLSV